MENSKIVGMLNQDLEGEHAAIIQYLTHAYAMGEGEMACEIEAVAREEMRHFDWLAETIVGLGGVPTITRGKMRLDSKTVPEWMQDDIRQEVEGIELYEKHISAIDNPKIKRLLRRILSDEKAHQAKFEHFVGKARKAELADLRGRGKHEDGAVLNWGIEHEYTVILQYLIHSYLASSEEMKEQMADQAVNEMQHLGWLAEELVDGGDTPVIEHAGVDQSRKAADMLRADIDIENKVAAEYDRAAKATEDEGLKTLLTRIRDHEVYHAEVFGDLLKEEEGKP